MVHNTRTFIPLLMVFSLFITCGLANSGARAHSTPRSTLHPLASLTRQLSPIATDVCPSPLETCLTPRALRAAYGVEALIQRGFTGKGQTVIVIVSFGNPTLQRDMNVFNRTFNLPPVDLQVISPLKVPESDPYNHKEGWALETAMDVQIIHALAPEAKVIVLQSPVAEIEGTFGLPEFRQLQQYIIDRQLGHIVSQSWGTSELTLNNPQGLEELQKWHAILQQGTTKHRITYFSASGDNGATNYLDFNHQQLGKVPSISFAANSPWVTSVGGTTLKHTTPTLSETAWNGSGGGFSRFHQMPPYQKLLPPEVHKQFNNRRLIPDVSAVADPATGPALYLRGKWMLGGGTSASAPVWAAIQAIANQMAGRPLGFINPALYKLLVSPTYRQNFRDVIQGNNSNQRASVKGYSAVPGWDPVTGLGTPNAEKLIPNLIAALK